MTSEYITIKLSKYGKNRGKYESIIDEADKELDYYDWCVVKYGNLFYVQRRLPDNTKVILHREVMERKLERKLLFHEIVDHIDKDTLNNRRDNLRIATKSTNGMNRGKPSNNTSGYKGVTWSKQHRKWISQISHKGKHYHIGLFNDPKEAWEAYCRKADELHQDFANYGDKE